MTGNIRSVVPFTLTEKIRSGLALTHPPARGNRLSPFPLSLQEDSDRRTMRDKYMVETDMPQYNVPIFLLMLDREGHRDR
jgi:hypothetical protein